MTIDRKPVRGKSKDTQVCSQAIAALIGASKLTGARIVAWMAGTMGILTGAFFMGFRSRSVVICAIPIAPPLQFLGPQAPPRWRPEISGRSRPWGSFGR